MEIGALLTSVKNVDRQLGTYLDLQKMVTLSLYSHRRDHYGIHDLHRICVKDVRIDDSKLTLRIGTEMELQIDVDKQIARNLRLFCKPPKMPDDFVFDRLYHRLLR